MCVCVRLDRACRGEKRYDTLAVVHAELQTALHARLYEHVLNGCVLSVCCRLVRAAQGVDGWMEGGRAGVHPSLAYPPMPVPPLMTAHRPHGGTSVCVYIPTSVPVCHKALDGRMVRQKEVVREAHNPLSLPNSGLPHTFECYERCSDDNRPSPEETSSACMNADGGARAGMERKRGWEGGTA